MIVASSDLCSLAIGSSVELLSSKILSDQDKLQQHMGVFAKAFVFDPVLRTRFWKPYCVVAAISASYEERLYV